MAALKSVGGSGQRNLCLRVLLLCLVLTAVASRTGAEQSPSPGGGYYALLIGQAASPGDGLEAMAAVENDLRGFKTMLEGMTATPYRIRFCLNPDRAGIVKAMNTAFREAGPEDLCLIYYGGHGKNSAVEHRRALMVGADGETLAAAELLKLLEEVPGKKVLILDSCYAGMVIDVRRQQANEMQEDGIIYILAGAASGEEALNSGSGPDACGLFTWSLLYGSGYDERTKRELPGLPADQDQNGRISFQEAYLYTHAMTTGVSGAQHPQADPLNSDITLWSKERSQEE